MPERKRSTAGILDTAILVFFGLIVAIVAWKILASVVGWIFFFVKLFVLALMIAVLVRIWLWTRRRTRRRTEAVTEFPRRAA